MRPHGTTAARKWFLEVVCDSMFLSAPGHHFAIDKCFSTRGSLSPRVIARGVFCRSTNFQKGLIWHQGPNNPINVPCTVVNWE